MNAKTTEGWELTFFFCGVQLLLRKKAAEELKKEQERKAAERRRIIEERCGKPKNLEDANEGTRGVVLARPVPAVAILGPRLSQPYIST